MSSIYERYLDEQNIENEQRRLEYAGFLSCMYISTDRCKYKMPQNKSISIYIKWANIQIAKAKGQFTPII